MVLLLITFAKELRREGWESVFGKTKAARFMTKNVRMDFEKLQETQNMVEFSQSNIESLLEAVLMSRDSIADMAIIEAFDLMTEYHKGNRVYFEGVEDKQILESGKEIHFT